MKKTNKKGFTIVELVIVIAVIAILAAVLIPTFANVIEKANKSAALQAAKNAYTEDLAEFDGVYTTDKQSTLTLQGFFTFDDGAVTAYVYKNNANYDMVYLAADATAATTINSVAVPATAKAGWNYVSK